MSLYLDNLTANERWYIHSLERGMKEIERLVTEVARLQRENGEMRVALKDIDQSLYEANFHNPCGRHKRLLEVARAALAKGAK